MPRDGQRPFPITLEVELLDRLSEPVRDGKVKSLSELIRRALEHFDFSNVVVMKPSQLQVSVRLPAEVRRHLRQVSRRQHVSIGHLVRAAVDAYLPVIESGSDQQLEMPIDPGVIASVETGVPAPVVPPAPGARPKRRRKPPAGRRRPGKKPRAQAKGKRPMTGKRKG